MVLSLKECTVSINTCKPYTVYYNKTDTVLYNQAVEKKPVTKSKPVEMSEGKTIL